jgi:hypothetical protein
MKRTTRGWLGALSALVLAAFMGPASASAFTVWRVGGVNVSSPVLTDITAPMSFTHTGGIGGTFTIGCRLDGRGTVSAGGAGSILSLQQRDPADCRTIYGPCFNPRVTIVNLSWNIQVSGGRLNFTPGPSGRPPGAMLECAGFISTCAGSISAALSNTGEEVQASFDASSGTAICNDGAHETEGGSLLFSVAGTTLSVT